MVFGTRGGACSSTRSLIVEGTSRPVGFTGLTEVGGAGGDFATAARGTGVSGALAGGGAGRVAAGAAAGALGAAAAA